jgi:hypothetical protein
LSVPGPGSRISGVACVMQSTTVKRSGARKSTHGEAQFNPLRMISRFGKRDGQKAVLHGLCSPPGTATGMLNLTVSFGSGQAPSQVNIFTLSRPPWDKSSSRWPSVPFKCTVKLLGCVASRSAPRVKYLKCDVGSTWRGGASVASESRRLCCGSEVSPGVVAFGWRWWEIAVEEGPGAWELKAMWVREE